MAYEALLLFGLLIVTLIAPHAILAAFSHHVVSATTLWSHFFLLLLAYFLFFWVKGGQTLPMKTWRIRLVTRSGGPVPPNQALLRYVLCWPSLWFGGLGLAWALIDRDRQFLHDRLAGTRLIDV